MTDPDLPRIARILQKLAEVRARGLSCFGSEKHGFELNPPLSEAEIARFEVRHYIRLPSAYRAFLRHAGGSGAGPYYGLFPLAKWYDATWSGPDELPADFLARRAALRPGLNSLPEKTDDRSVDSGLAGTIAIAEQGCGHAVQLIVSGEAAGRVCYVDADREAAYVVRSPDFLAWYERWLDELLQDFDTGWFGYGPDGGEREFFAALDDPQSGDDVKGEAAFAFCRLPRLSEAGTARIPSYLSHPLPRVRAGACATIEKFAITSTIEVMASLLRDADPEVRRQAIATVMKLAPDRWAATIRTQMLEEAEAEVAHTAFSKLEKSGKLERADLLGIIGASVLGSLRAAAVHALKWTEADQELARGLLNDPDPKMRRDAVSALRQLKGHASLPAALDRLSLETDANVVDRLLGLMGEIGDAAAASALLRWATADDDFHRLHALEALAKLGDGRAVAVAEAMLRETRQPERKDAFGMSTHIDSIATLARKALKTSPNPKLRRLASYSRDIGGIARRLLRWDNP